MRISEKWGFGMAPVKPETAAARAKSVRAVQNWIGHNELASAEFLEDLSVVKGLFTRCWKADQWDWFTVWSQLGRPKMKACKRVSQKLSEARNSLKDDIEDTSPIETLRTYSVDHYLAKYLGVETRFELGVGFIYVLSTREQKNFLKIGYTDRTVDERIKELNSATAIAIPFGVRYAWTVKNARGIEKMVHDTLREYRIRKDREFFDIDFYVAKNEIDRIVDELE